MSESHSVTPRRLRRRRRRGRVRPAGPPRLVRAAGALRPVARKQRKLAGAARRGPAPEVVQLEALPLVETLSHELGELLRRFGGYRRKRALVRDPEYRAAQPEIERLLCGLEWDLRAATATQPTRPGRLRAIAWNVERGKRFEPLLGTLTSLDGLASPDLVFLTELDIGMGRSGNRNVPRELARALGMGYVFSNFHLVLARGDRGEQLLSAPNSHAMHGSALLTRFPVRRVSTLRLPEWVDKFHVLEKRLGDKRALFVELALPDGPLTVVVVHLDPFCPPRHRAWQMQLVLEHLEHFGARRVLLGGDLNTHTWDAGSAPGLAISLAHKLVRFGFAGTVANYMTPERVFERGVFDALSHAGLSTEGFVDPSRGTVYYDMHDPEVIDKSLDEVPRPVLNWLERRLRPWGGCVPLRMDWFAGRGVTPAAAWTVSRPRHQGQRVADHDPLGVELALGEAGPARAGGR